MARSLFGLLILAAGLVAGGCFFSAPSAMSRMTVPIEVMRGGSMVGLDEKEPGGIWIADRKQLDDFSIRHIKKTKIGGTSDFPEKIDFSKEGMLIVWMGLKPTGGHALQTVADQAAIENRSAIVPIRRITPEQGAMLTQVITQPYLMLRVGKGDFDSIAIVDPDGPSRIVVPVCR